MPRLKCDDDPNIKRYLVTILEEQGRNFYKCDLCNKKTKTKCNLHHAKYEMATINDIKLVCCRCNNADSNIGLK
jgi:hypothetical protein